jgi:hypothetical protein
MKLRTYNTLVPGPYCPDTGAYDLQSITRSIRGRSVSSNESVQQRGRRERWHDHSSVSREDDFGDKVDSMEVSRTFVG